MRRLFLPVHQAGITNDIRHKNRGKPPFDALARNEAFSVRIDHPLISDSSQY
jgi:hypothetical protein